MKTAYLIYTVDNERWLPISKVAAALGVLLALVSSMVPTGTLRGASQGCQAGVERMKIGPLSYDGQDGNEFDYVSVARNDGKFWYYGVAIKNTGKQLLTVDWPKPKYFRRGIAPQDTGYGQCLTDGNPPNQDVGTILYGPNTQFTGPMARFYRPAPSTDAQQAGVLISFDSHLDPTQVVAVRVALDSRYKIGSSTIGYTLENKGSSVRIRWKAIEGPHFYRAANAQLGTDISTVMITGLLVQRQKTSRVEVFAEGIKAKRILQVLEILTPDGVLIYRDLAPAFTFDEIASYNWAK